MMHLIGMVLVTAGGWAVSTGLIWLLGFLDIQMGYIGALAVYAVMAFCCLYLPAKKRDSLRVIRDREYILNGSGEMTQREFCASEFPGYERVAVEGNECCYVGASGTILCTRWVRMCEDAGDNGGESRIHLLVRCLMVLGLGIVAEESFRYGGWFCLKKGFVSFLFLLGEVDLKSIPQQIAGSLAQLRYGVDWGACGRWIAEVLSMPQFRLDDVMDLWVIMGVVCVFGSLTVHLAAGLLPVGEAVQNELRGFTLESGNVGLLFLLCAWAYERSIEAYTQVPGWLRCFGGYYIIAFLVLALGCALWRPHRDSEQRGIGRRLIRSAFCYALVFGLMAALLG